MYYIVEIACIVAEICYIHMFLRSVNILGKRELFKTFLCYSIFGVIITILSVFSDNSLLRICVTFIGITLISRFLFQATPLSSLFSSFVFVAIVILNEVLVMILLSFIGIDNKILMVSGNGRMLYVISSHIILFGIIAIACLINRHGGSIVSTKNFLSLLPCWLVSILLGCMLCKFVETKPADLHPLYLLVMVGLLYTNIAMVYFTNRLSEQEQEKHKAELAEHHYAMQKEYYQQFHAQQEDTKALWHDISKYMRAMQVLASQNNTKEAEAVVSQVQSLIDSVDGVVDVNNRVVSVILNEYIVSAKELNVKIKLDVQVPSELFVTAADLYVLIGNTLDNALDACSELDEYARNIDLHLRLHNDILFYQLSNPYLASHIKRKRNQYHGYGLKNVCKCVERYNGSLTTDDSNGIFCVTARLNSI